MGVDHGHERDDQLSDLCEVQSAERRQMKMKGYDEQRI